MTVFNKSKVEFFESADLHALENEVNNFILTTIRVYNVKHTIEYSEEFNTIHYIMVSYE